MAHAEWCGKYECGDCPNVHECPIDLSMPCSPSCEGLYGYKINLKHCVNSGCLDNLLYMFYGDDKGEELFGLSPLEQCRKLVSDFADENGYAKYPY